MNDDTVHAIGIYRSATTRDLRITFSDGTSEDVSDVPLEVEKAALAALKRSDLSSKDLDGTDWFVHIESQDRRVRGDHEEDRPGDSQGDGRDQENSQGRDGGDGDSQSDGDGDTDDDGDGDDGDGDGDGDQEGDDDMDFSKRQSDGGDEEAPIDTDELANDLWPHLLPNVRAVAHNYAQYAAEYAIARAEKSGGGSGGGSGLTLHFEKGKIGKVEGVTHKMFPKVLAAVQRGCNVYLPGPPGTGKSHMAEQVAEALGIPFNVDSFSPMSTESKLLGFRNAHGEPVQTGFERVYAETGGVELFDEMDNANGAVLAVMNGGLANGQLGFASGVRKRHKDFVAIATANTLGTGPTAEFAGRQKIDPATLNRFVKIYIDTDEAMEDHIIHSMIGDDQGAKWLKLVRQVRRAVADLRIKHFVTMRDSINGARLVAPGDGAFTMLEALEHTILGVLTPDQVDKIKNWRG